MNRRRDPRESADVVERAAGLPGDRGINRDAFVARRRREWQRLEGVLGALEAHQPARFVAELPALYRRACQDLALARARLYGEELERRLHQLVLRGHQQIYQQRPARGEWLEVLRAGLPRLVRQEARLLLLCVALLAVPLLGMAIAVHRHDDLVYTLLDAQQVRSLEEMYGTGSGGPRPAASDVVMFGSYVHNNIGIAFRTFATGLFLGVGAFVTLLVNGLYFGAIAGHLIHVGSTARFFSFVIGHSAPELTGIVLSGVAGARLGLCVLAPGPRTRQRALLDEGRRLVPLLWGVAALLLLAAFVEAFWSAAALPPAVHFAAGAVLWAAVLAYFGLAGRGDAA